MSANEPLQENGEEVLEELVVPPDDPETPLGLAEMEQRRGPFFGPGPEEWQERLNKMESEFGEDSVEVAETLLRLGDSCMAQGSLFNDDAYNSYLRAAEIFERNRPDAIDTADAHERVSDAAHSMRRHDLRAEHLRKAISILEKLTTVSDESGAVKAHLESLHLELESAEKVLRARFTAPSLPQTDQAT